MFPINNYEARLKIQIKSKETHTQNIVRLRIKPEELVRLVAAPVKG